MIFSHWRKSKKKFLDKVKARMEEIMKDNSYPFLIVDVQATNFDWSDEFDRQIALTMNRAQEVKQSQQELEKAKIDSQRQVAEARSRKTSIYCQSRRSKTFPLLLRQKGKRESAIAKAEGELKVAELSAQAKRLDGDAIQVLQ